MKILLFIKSHLALFAFFGSLLLIGAIFLISALSSVSKQSSLPKETLQPPSLPKGSPIAIPNAIPTPIIIPQLLTPPLTKIQFNISEHITPKSLPVYGISYRIPDSFITTLAHELSFTELSKITADSQGQKVWWYNSDDGSSQLQIVPQQGYISLTIQPFFGKTDDIRKTAIDSKEAGQIAKQYLQSIGLVNSDLTINSSGIKYLSEEDLTNASSPSSSPITIDSDGYFLVPFTQLLQKYPIFFQYGSSNSSFVQVNPRGQVIGFTYFYQEVSENSQNISLLTFPELKSQVLSGKVSIISPSSEDIPEEIDSIAYSSLATGYLSDKKTGFISPIFIVSGTAIDKNGSTFETTGYLPAFK